MLQLEKIKNGDSQEMAQIYSDYKDEFIGFMRNRYGCDQTEARDIYQMSILALQENIINGKLTELRSSIKTYLFAIGKNKFLETRNSNQRFLHGYDFEVLKKSEELDKEKQETEVKLGIVESCLQEIGDPARSLLELYYYHGLSMEEIALKLGYKNSSTVKNLKYKFLNRLRKVYMEQAERREDEQ